ncbi:MAG: TIGR02206 family membrane protein [Verrucomicrobiota bacterium]
MLAQFQLFGPGHLGALAVTAMVLGFAVYAARTCCCPAASDWFERLLALGLIFSFPAKVITRLVMGYDITSVILPMHLCDWAAIAGFFALLWRHPLSMEILYFWGVAGTLQGLLTPAIGVDFPDPTYFAFFLLHSGVVIAALYLPLGLGWRPRPGAVKRVFALGLVYVGVASAINWSFGFNFGFFREKPPGSLMDFLGPVPWHVFSLIGLALVMFMLLNLPFLIFKGSAAKRYPEE